MNARSSHEGRLADIEENLNRLQGDRRRLLDEIAAIQDAISDPNRLDPKTGKRMPGDEYWLWRQLVKRQMKQKEHSVRTINAVAHQLASERTELLRDPTIRGISKPGRAFRIEAKLDLLLAHFGLELPEGHGQVDPVDDIDDDVDEHGTPRSDALRHRLPGSFEQGKRR